jgi:hypothetical protein
MTLNINYMICKGRAVARRQDREVRIVRTGHHHHWQLTKHPRQALGIVLTFPMIETVPRLKRAPRRFEWRYNRHTMAEA